jgi:outer membrane immunogenic protein
MAMLLPPLVLAGPAAAADVEIAPEPEPLVYDWSGFYAGAHVGYGEAQVDGNYQGSSFGLDPNGLLGGVHAGFNWQLGSFVIGTEGDFSWGDLEDSTTSGGGLGSASAEIDWLATLRARVGVALDNFLLYGTIGGAWSEAEAAVTNGGAESVDFDEVGLVAGGGVEWGMNEKLSWKLEGLWFNFDDTVDLESGALGDSTTLDDAWVVSTGIRYRF